ncbi:MAG: hypothetical protein M3N56_04845, partial [Actinomycetota bacterium]|nr:hypothetical protein [Actinomycetota bacterium]
MRVICDARIAREADAGAGRLHYGRDMRALWRTTTPLDRLIAAGLVVAGEVEVWLTHSYEGPRGLTATLALLRGFALLWRRSHPVVVLAIQVAAMAPVLLH